jgi:hypothetical protein
MVSAAKSFGARRKDKDPNRRAPIVAGFVVRSDGASLPIIPAGGLKLFGL